EDKRTVPVAKEEGMRNFKKSLAMVLVLTTVFSGSVYAQDFGMEAAGVAEITTERVGDNFEIDVAEMGVVAEDVEATTFSFEHDKYVFEIIDGKNPYFDYKTDYYEVVFYEKDPEENVSCDVSRGAIQYNEANGSYDAILNLDCGDGAIQSCESSDNSVVMISKVNKNSVTIRAMGLGKAAITAVNTEGETASCIVSIAGTKPKFKYSLYNAVIGEKKFLGFEDSQFDGSIEITSSDNSLATIIKEREWDDDYNFYIDKYYVKGTGQGTITITLTASLGRKATTSVKVVKPITDISVPRNIFLNPRQTKTIKPTLTPADSMMAVNYKSSNTSVATVDANGRVKAIKNGIATITVTDAKNKVEKKVKAYINTTGINKTKLSLYRKDSEYLHYFGKETVVWKCSDTSVAKVSTSGKVTALKKGVATITAKAGGKTYQCEVTVKNPRLSETSLSLRGNGSPKTLSVIGVIGQVKWTSSNTSVARVSSTGKVTPRLGGTATITALANGIKLTCSVTVTKVPAITIHEGGVQRGIGACDPWFTVSNNRNKTIQSLDFTSYYYDKKGNPVYCERTGKRSKKLHFAGPFSPFKKKFLVYWNGVMIYNEDFYKMKLTYVTINYKNGTKEKIAIQKTYISTFDE
ncbi:MAG: Ig-like domain-containing protein, partial [Lachnospiraceae bacterium]|nr:Ig-like domain-containing protein [Lachnospiraceae bacterium]